MIIYVYVFLQYAISTYYLQCAYIVIYKMHIFVDTIYIYTHNESCYTVCCCIVNVFIRRTVHI